MDPEPILSKIVDPRISESPTPEERLAAVVRAAVLEYKKIYNREMDYADFKTILRLYVHRELLIARIDEARICHAEIMTQRIQQLNRELEQINKAIPFQNRL